MFIILGKRIADGTPVRIQFKDLGLLDGFYVSRFDVVGGPTIESKVPISLPKVRILTIDQRRMVEDIAHCLSAGYELGDIEDPPCESDSAA